MQVHSVRGQNAHPPEKGLMQQQETNESTHNNQQKINSQKFKIFLPDKLGKNNSGNLNRWIDIALEKYGITKLQN